MDGDRDGRLPLTLWLLWLNMFTLFRFFTAIPFCITIGLIDPFWVQSLFFSPIYKGDTAPEYRWDDAKEAINQIRVKLELLPNGQSSLIPLSIPISVSSKIDNAHAIYLLITRLSENNYRLSIIDNGAFAAIHPKRGKNKYDVD